MKYLNFCIAAVSFVLSSSAYAAPPKQQSSRPHVPNIIVSVSSQDNNRNRQEFITKLVNMAGLGMKHIGKLIIDDVIYDPNYRQAYYVIDGDQAHDKVDYWGRDALVDVLLSVIPEPPGRPSPDGQYEYPDTPVQSGLIGRFWLWPKHEPKVATPNASNAPKSILNRLDGYHASAESFSRRYTLWSQQVLQLLNQLDVRTTTIPTLKLIDAFKSFAQSLARALESEEEGIQHTARALQNGSSKFKSLKATKEVMVKHQKIVKNILDVFEQEVNQYLLVDWLHSIKLKIR
ncbi:hypothetical protein QVD99_000054 [Batrachochytrium dendrobatidis]|nr:hypothetical protein QVD99_000054 [Batrachochytrium dendrobatidis]